MATTDVTAALCAAIDQGDDVALAALADLLEGQDDAIAPLLRRVLAMPQRPTYVDHTIQLAGIGGEQTWKGWKWYCDTTYVSRRNREYAAAFGRLRGGHERCSAEGIRTSVTYPTRSGAFLAMANALATGVAFTSSSRRT